MGQLTEFSKSAVKDLQVKLSVIKAATPVNQLAANLAYHAIDRLVTDWQKIQDDDAALTTLFTCTKAYLLAHYVAISEFFADCDASVQPMFPMLIESIEWFLEKVPHLQNTESQHILFSAGAVAHFRRDYLLGDEQCHLGVAPQSHKESARIPAPHFLSQTRALFFNPWQYDQDRQTCGLTDASRNNLFKQFNSAGLDVATLKKLLVCYITDDAFVQTLSALAGQGLMPAFSGVEFVDEEQRIHRKSPRANVCRWNQCIDLVNNTISISEYHYVFYSEESSLMEGFYLDSTTNKFILARLAQIETIKMQTEVSNELTSALTSQEKALELTLVRELIGLPKDQPYHQQRIAEIKTQLQEFANKTQIAWLAKLKECHGRIQPFMQTHLDLELIKNPTSDREVSFRVPRLEIELHAISLRYRSPVESTAHTSLQEVSKYVRVVSMTPNLRQQQPVDLVPVSQESWTTYIVKALGYN